MAIKDQCEKCRFNEENGCSKLVPSFDGTSCDVCIKRINLEKDKEELAETTPIISDIHDESSESVDTYYGNDDEDVPSDESIHGIPPSVTLSPAATTLRLHFFAFLSSLRLSRPIVSAVP